MLKPKKRVMVVTKETTSQFIARIKKSFEPLPLDELEITYSPEDTAQDLYEAVLRLENLYLKTLLAEPEDLVVAHH
jgi:hypothetical protein